MKKLILDKSGTEIEYQVRKHKASRNLRIRITPEHKIIVTIPRYLPIKAGELFLDKQKDWIKEQLHKLPTPQKKLPRADISLLKVTARNMIREKISHFNAAYNFNFSRITIRDQKTRWGSCSSNGTLSFNYRLALLPGELVDYVVVHELCHLKEMNHSSRFWDLVAKTIPDHPIRRRQLTAYARTLN